MLLRTSRGLGLILRLGVYVTRIGVNEAKRLVYALLENLKQHADNML